MASLLEPKGTNKGNENDSADNDGYSHNTNNSYGDDQRRCTTKTNRMVVPASKKRVVKDETLLPADEAEKLLTKRAYNRECASRARKRGKELIIQLEKQVKELQSDKNELRRSLATMEKQLKLLDGQNRSLLAKQILPNYDGMIANAMLQQLPISQYPLRGELSASDFRRTTSKINGASFITQNRFF
jgi:hypothetical protein